MNTNWKYKINGVRWEILQVSTNKFLLMKHLGLNTAIQGKFLTKHDAEFKMLEVEEIRQETKKQEWRP